MSRQKYTRPARIPKTFRLSRHIIELLETRAAEETATTGRKITQTSIIESALEVYVYRTDL